MTTMTSSATPKDFESDATFRQYQIAVDVYIVGTLCTLGIAGNMLSIIVLGRDRTIRHTTGFMLQMLAIADTGYLLACVVYQTFNCVVRQTDWLPEAAHHRWPYVEVYAWPMASVAQTATSWLVVVVTADRYVAVCRPLHAAHYSTISRVRRAVAVVWIMAAVYNLPRFFERVVQVDVASANLTSAVGTSTTDVGLPITSTSSEVIIVESRRIEVRHTALRENALYVLVYKTCFFIVVRFLLPFTALAFFNQRLIRAMRVSDEIRRQSRRVTGNNGGKERQLTRTLVVVVVVFVVCELPGLILRAWLAVHQHAPEHVAFPRRQLLYVNTASNLLLTVNSCVNFVIYCFMGRRFRAILLRTLCCRGGGGGRSDRSPDARAVCLRTDRTLAATAFCQPQRRTQRPGRHVQNAMDVVAVDGRGSPHSRGTAIVLSSVSGGGATVHSCNSADNATDTGIAHFV